MVHHRIEAGVIILDDLLQDPGLQIGILEVQNCPQSLAILNQTDPEKEDKSNDALYQLAHKVLTAELNLAVGSETCPAVEETHLAVRCAHPYYWAHLYSCQ